MEFRLLKNKQGEPLTTQDGRKLYDLFFEPGDEFIPQYETIIEKTREVEVKGKLQKITDYTLKVRARDKNKKAIEHNGSVELYVKLTPTQAKMLRAKKDDDGIELTQNVFRAYEYESDTYGGKHVGVGLKKDDFKDPITFEEFENQPKDDSSATKKPSPEAGVEESLVEEDMTASDSEEDEEQVSPEIPSDEEIRKAMERS